MTIGHITIFVATLASIFSAFFYWTAWSRSKNKKGDTIDDPALLWGRYAFYVMTGLVFIAGMYLWYLFFTHQFQFKYVFSYSSRDLSSGLLFSALWAGQEGSFLLWALINAVLGLFFVRNIKKFEATSMFFLNLAQLFFLIILIKASPFAQLPRVAPDGNGLNPLLQNFWMIIHPPILFIGYSAITFPAVLALAALVQKKYDAWIHMAFPWVVFTSLTLGAGIIIGGFWSYEVLGWGGYWAWDPVENSSLIPWLTTLALLHGLIIQKRSGALRRSNSFIAVISLLLVLYATFLTRSGVLADFSVHSFQDLGIHNILLYAMFVLIGVLAVLMFTRFSSVTKVELDFSNLNRENTLLASMWVFCGSALLTLIGTSSPLISAAISSPSQVGIDFYNKVNLPIGILMALLVGVSPLLYWKEEQASTLIQRVVYSIIGGVIAAVVIWFFGLRNVELLIFTLASGFALVSNIVVLSRKIKLHWLNIGGPLSHIGFALMLFGIIVSGQFSETQKIVLNEDQKSEIFGTGLTYTGFTEVSSGKNFASIDVEKNGSVSQAQPRFYYSRYNDGVMREPEIFAGWFSDLYISPLDRREAAGGTSEGLVLKKGETKSFAGYDITFNKFEMSNHEEMDAFGVGAVLHVVQGDRHFELTPTLIMGAQKKMIPAVIPETQPQANVSLAGIEADQGQIRLQFNGLKNTPVQKAPEQLLVEVSSKPFMSVLWLGCVFIMGGGLIAYIRRQSNLNEEAA